MAGLSRVSTTMPPTTAWAITPNGQRGRQPHQVTAPAPVRLVAKAGDERQPGDRGEREVQQPVAELDPGVQRRLPDAARGDHARLGALRPVRQPSPTTTAAPPTGGDDDRVGDHHGQREPAHRGLVGRSTGANARKPGRHAPHRNAWALGRAATAAAARPRPPADARPLAMLSRWPSMPSLISAATVGCRVIHSPNTLAGPPQRPEPQRVGDHHDSSPIARAGGQQDGRTCAGPPRRPPAR